MIRFVLRRMASALFVMFSISVLVFLIFFATPGNDPAARIAGKNATPQTLKAVRHDFGLDRPLPVQYVLMMKKLFVTRDLTSYVNIGDRILPQIVEAAPVTFSLVLGASVIWVLFAVGMGLVAAVFRGTAVDVMVMIVGLVGISMPVFWLGILARYFLAEKNTWFPDGEYVPLTQDPFEWFWHLILPWFVLAVLFIGFYGRVLRGNILDTINEDYVRTARAKGIAPRRVMAKHVLRNSLIPIVTLFGLDFAAVLGGGAILTETVFDLHGVGQYAAQSIANFDLPPIIGVTLFGAFFIVFFSAVVDLAYAVLDPRIRPT